MSAPVMVSPVRSRGDKKAFLQFPYDLYRDFPFWVPPLRMDTAKLINPKKNAFFEHGSMELFLARDSNGKVLGRIAGIVNGMHLRKYEDATGFFGFYDAVDDKAVAGALFDAAAGWLRAQGMIRMRGPANPSLNDTAGLLISGFHRFPFILMPYNAPWFESQLTDWGFERVMTMWAFYSNEKYVHLDKLKRGVGLIMKRYPGLSIREIDMSRFAEEARLIMDIYNDAWSENWGHVPMTDGEFDQLAKDMKMIIDPRVVFIVEDGGVPVGFSVSLPDLNVALKTLKSGRLLPFGLFKLLFLAKSGAIRELRLPLLGVRKSHQGRGIDSILINQTIQNGTGIGYSGCEMSWVLDGNARLKNALLSMGGVIDKEYGMFEAVIS